MLKEVEIMLFVCQWFGLMTYLTVVNDEIVSWFSSLASYI